MKKNNFYIHESSYTDKNVSIGQGTSIWHFSHLQSGCSVGENCTIGQNVNIGNKVKIQNNVSVYDGVTLEDDVFCGPSMVFTNVYNPRSAIERKDQYLSTLIKKGATLGANCTIVCGVTVGEYAFVGAGAVVNKDVPPYALVVGVPGKQIGWMSEYGERLELPLEGKREVLCQKTQQKYLLDGKKLSLL